MDRLMSNEPSLESEQERRLQDVLADYIGAMEAGEMPDRAALLDQHPDLADELIVFFANHDDLALSGPRARPAKPTDHNSGPARTLAPTNSKPRIGEFEILHEMARGGMGVVYKARQVSLGREVALKMILTNKSESGTLLRRFRTEVEAVAHLDHPNIVPIYEVGEIDGDPFFTMKLVEGGSLSSRFAEFCLPIRGEDPRRGRAELRRTLMRFVELLATVARAVHHAHQRGILHRDLKPANILLDGEARPMVADFGLAKRVDRDCKLTRSLAVIGTASYMAPEQARPNKNGLTVAADVYSLGAIFYEFLTGRPPIVGHTPFDTLLRVAEEIPVPPRKRNPNVPRDLEMICLRCLLKEPGKRYGSALELAEDLERWRAGDAISLRASTSVERFRRAAKRNPLAMALLGMVATTLVVATAVSLLAAWNIAASRDLAAANAEQAESNARQASLLAESEHEARNQAESARDAAEKAGVENRRLLVSGYVANGTRALDGGDPFGALVWYGGPCSSTAATSPARTPTACALLPGCAAVPD
jgi:serine/threonine protein kinase